jgi:hypothetical protein
MPSIPPTSSNSANRRSSSGRSRIALGPPSSGSRWSGVRRYRRRPARPCVRGGFLRRAGDGLFQSGGAALPRGPRAPVPRGRGALERAVRRRDAHPAGLGLQQTTTRRASSPSAILTPALARRFAELTARIRRPRKVARLFLLRPARVPARTSRPACRPARRGRRPRGPSNAPGCCAAAITNSSTDTSSSCSPGQGLGREALRPRTRSPRPRHLGPKPHDRFLEHRQPAHAPRQYEYTADFLWSNTVQQAASACSDYFKLERLSHRRRQRPRRGRMVRPQLLRPRPRVLHRDPQPDSQRLRRRLGHARPPPSAPSRPGKRLRLRARPRLRRPPGFPAPRSPGPDALPDPPSSPPRSASAPGWSSTATPTTSPPTSARPRPRRTDDGPSRWRGAGSTAPSPSSSNPCPPPGCCLPRDVRRRGRPVDLVRPPPRFDLAGASVLERWRASAA